jgi:hypothetical protein
MSRKTNDYQNGHIYTGQERGCQAKMSAQKEFEMERPILGKKLA